MPEEFKNKYVVEGFLETSPIWLAQSPYFGAMGLELVTEHIGGAALRIDLPIEKIGQCYVADYAHLMDIRHFHANGSIALGFEYSRQDPRDVCLAYLNSYIEAVTYDGAHVSPVFQFLVESPGIAIAPEFIHIVDSE